jgi:hypothetical protein
VAGSEGRRPWLVSAQQADHTYCRHKSQVTAIHRPFFDSFVAGGSRLISEDDVERLTGKLEVRRLML